MAKEIPPPSALPRIDGQVLVARLSSVRGALGAARLGIARRLTAADVVGEREPFEVLAVVDVRGALPDPERQLPLAAFQSLLADARVLEAESSADTSLGRWLRQHGDARLRGWPLPNDRAVSVMAVATFEAGRVLGPTRRRVAAEGLEALARALAPPAWAPLARSPGPRPVTSPPVEEQITALAGSEVLPLRDAIDLMERIMIQRALQCSEGNKAAAARTLHLSRQGLYKKLKRHGLA